MDQRLSGKTAQDCLGRDQEWICSELKFFEDEMEATSVLPTLKTRITECDSA